MSWDCNLILAPELDEHGNVDFSKRKVGDMWFLDLPVAELRDRHLAEFYWKNNSDRKPIVVVMPGMSYFVVDAMCYSEEKGYHNGWTVEGVPPYLTMTPSINMPDKYHGYLSQGVITNDIEGRTF